MPPLFDLTLSGMLRKSGALWPNSEARWRIAMTPGGGGRVVTRFLKIAFG
jgi:hypothetical protein